MRTFEPAIAGRARGLLEAVDRRERELSVGETLEDRILDWSMADPDRKTRILRFIDVFPALKTDAEIVDHLKQYFPHSDQRLPLTLRAGLSVTGGLLTGRLVAGTARMVMKNMASRFIGGETEAEAAESIRRLRAQKLEYTLDFLGEATLSEPEADLNLESILSMLAYLSRDGARAHFSVKCSSLTSFLDPVDPDEVARRLAPRLRALFRQAAEKNAFLHFDAEHYETCDLVLDLVLKLLDEPDGCALPDAGIVIQSYLHDAAARVDRVLDWCRRHRRSMTVRLVKGAYWDSEVIRARRLGHAEPVYLNKWETDAAFERILLTLLDAHAVVRTAVASHNLRSIAAAQALAEELKAPPGQLEFQFLHGMARATRSVLVDQGHTVRVYMPYGRLIPGMAYLVRRLLENSSNVSFLRRRRIGDQPAEELLNPPRVSPPAEPERVDRPPDSAGDTFHNVPLIEFFRKGVREAMHEALQHRLMANPERIGPIIDGQPVGGKTEILSLNPSHPDRVVAETDLADAQMAKDAVCAARRAWPKWRNTSAAGRARILRAAASLMTAKRHELAALEVCEAGKPWEEAQADVAEAIDYLRYYATEAERLEAGRRYQPHVPGELNLGMFRPRGVAAVISPWNFPLAIPAGQTAAALAAGNCVVFKPAEQTPLVAHHLARIYFEAGLPAGVLQFLPGIGEWVGPALVEHPDVDVIAFTGSRAIGEEIIKRAAAAGPAPSGAKKVIAEMGGKNAVIVDSGADVDLAVQECVRSAFDYAGQKCSAAGRLILLKDIYEAFLKRFAAAVQSHPLGYAEIPSTRISPLIDAAALTRVNERIDLAVREGRWVLPPDPGRIPKEGYFVPPAIVSLTSVSARTAQEEIFGPLLAVLEARSIDEAIEIANSVPYALTGGIFSRHPGHIERVRRHLDVGNLYINRAITGAVVGRQPFGGHRASGVGSKAGGPDYLAQFCVPVTISENLTRHGFSPDVSR